MAKSILLVDATDLSIWAERRDAQAKLPQLLRRLALGTLPGAIEDIGFRAGEGVQFGGWDGIIQASVGNAFVPVGHSGWEVGTDSKIKGKADDDYEKRTKSPLELTPADTTYVFVTPRRWKNKKKWSQEKRKDGIWRDVRAYDADDIATWLEMAPAVHLWISNLLAKQPGFAEDLLTFWDSWSNVTRPALSTRLIAGSRQQCSEELRRWVTSQPSAIAVRGETSEEAIAFVAAAFQDFPDLERDRAFSRSIVATDLSGWQAFAIASQPLLLIPVFADRGRTPAAVAYGHHVLIPQGRNEPSVGATIELPRLRVADAKEALAAMGVSTDAVDDLARLARNSTGALRRRMAIHPASLIPKWAAPDVARSFLPALLAGRWTDDAPADQGIVAGLAGVAYADYRKLLLRWSNEPDPPVRQIGNLWTVVAKDDAWALLAHHLTDDDARRLEAASTVAIGETDPKYELPPDERWQAAIHRKVPRHSAALREGLADTLAVIAASSAFFPLGTSEIGQNIANRIVSRIIEQATSWQHWASLSGTFRLLAEAAPDVFLSAVERIVDGPAPIAANMFVDGDPFFTGSAHTDLLWALESLAWSPDYLGHAALILAKLDRVDPGGKTQNRPARSLHEIFLPWHPGTNASMAQRFRVIDNICKREPPSAWKLLVSLVPQQMGMAMQTAKPSRRDWAPDEEPTVTQRDYYKATVEVLRRMRDLVGTDGARWKNLIEALDDIPESEFDAVIQQLAAIQPASLHEKDRTSIWNALRAQLARHRKFPDAGWALPEEQLSKLDAEYLRFQPLDAIDRSIWLFSSKCEIPKRGLSDWREHRKAVEEAQAAAVDAILNAVGLEGVFSLAKRAERTMDVGDALARSSLPTTEDEGVLARALGAAEPAWRDLASGFLYGRRIVRGLAWLEGLRESPSWQEWTARQKADYFLALPFNATTWETVAKESDDVKQLYWTDVSFYGRGELTTEEVDQIARQFLNYRCYAKTIQLLALYSSRKAERPHARLAAEVLENVVSGGHKESNIDWGALADDVAQVLDLAESDESIGDARLSRLEWFFLPLTKHHRSAQKLQQALSTDPAFFLEIIKLVFKPRNGEPRQLSDEEIARAQYGYGLLMEWKRIPGSSREGAIDKAKLKDWVNVAREMAEQADRREIADVKIGEVLSNSPTGEDGLWPHEAIREVIDEATSEELESGIRVGVHNNRGVTTRAIGEVGKQERQIGERYRQYARAFSDQWPRASRLMTSIAESYSDDARREDTRAELNEELWATRRPIRPGPRLANPDQARELKVEV